MYCMCVQYIHLPACTIRAVVEEEHSTVHLLTLHLLTWLLSFVPCQPRVCVACCDALSLCVCLCIQTIALQQVEEESVRVQEDLKRQLESLRFDASGKETLNARLQEQIQQVRWHMLLQTILPLPALVTCLLK